MSGESKVAVGDMKELSRWGWVVGGGGVVDVTYRINVLIKEQMTGSEERLTSGSKKE